LASAFRGSHSNTYSVYTEYWADDGLRSFNDVIFRRRGKVDMQEPVTHIV
jgi:hypothetical protein